MTKTLRDVMKENSETLPETATVMEAAKMMAERNIGDAISLMRDKALRRIPIVENGKPVGIVSIGDLAEERDPKSALADISKAPPNK